MGKADRYAFYRKCALEEVKPPPNAPLYWWLREAMLSLWMDEMFPKLDIPEREVNDRELRAMSTAIVRYQQTSSDPQSLPQDQMV